jgi:hypothetical protein
MNNYFIAKPIGRFESWRDAWMALNLADSEGTPFVPDEREYIVAIPFK